MIVLQKIGSLPTTPPEPIERTGLFQKIFTITSSLFSSLNLKHRSVLSTIIHTGPVPLIDEQTRAKIQTALQDIQAFSHKNDRGHFQLIGTGKSKKVYTTSSESPSEVVYMTGNMKDLQKEIRIGNEIKRKIYLLNLQAFLECALVDKTKGKALAEKLADKYPTIEDLIRGLDGDDPQLHSFFAKYELAPLNWDSPEVRQLIENENNLAIDFQWAPPMGRVSKKPTVIAPKASTDLENFVRGRKCEFPKSIDYIKQLMSGYKNLHRIGRIHGDSKLNNVLVFGPPGAETIKLADWGKDKELVADKFTFSTGNCRYMPPERLASQKGEVFSMAMMAVRMLEEEFLKGDRQMLVEPDEINRTKEKLLRFEDDPKNCRKGIERYLIIAKGCPGVDSNWTTRLIQLIGAFKSFINPNRRNIDPQVTKYLNALQKELLIKYGTTSPLKVFEIIRVLRLMMKSDLNERITIEEALRFLENGNLQFSVQA